jgi:hypothetical protein
VTLSVVLGVFSAASRVPTTTMADGAAGGASIAGIVDNHLFEFVIGERNQAIAGGPLAGGGSAGGPVAKKSSAGICGRAAATGILVRSAAGWSDAAKPLDSGAKAQSPSCCALCE